MIKNIKIVFIDIDETLITEKHRFEVPIENRIEIKNAQKKGIYTVLCTGRDRKELFNIWKQIHFNQYGDYVIYANGSVIENIASKEKILDLRINEEDAKNVIEYCQKYNLSFRLSNEKHLWKSKSNKLKDYFSIRYLGFNFDTPPAKEEIAKKYDLQNKIGIFFSISKKKNEKMVHNLRKLFPSLEIITSTRGLFIEITNKDVNKGSGAKILLEKLFLQKEQAMAIGDSMNDYKLFKFLETTVAVKNASKKLKQIAKYETESAGKNGVALALQQIKND